MLKILYVALLVAFVSCVIAFLVVRVKQGGVKALFLKTISAVLFILSSFVALSMKPENYYYGVFIVIGLVFGMLGDIWLDLKFVHKDFDEQYTFAGIFSFMIGHIFYVVGILAAYPEFIGWQIALAIFSAVAVTAIVRFASVKMGFEYGKFNLLIAIYSVVTMLTVTFALNAVNAFGWLPILAGAPMPEFMPKLLCLNMGTVMFALSDLVLSFVFFKKGGNTSRNVVLNHSVYFTSQFILTLSILM